MIVEATAEERARALEESRGGRRFTDLTMAVRNDVAAFVESDMDVCRVVPPECAASNTTADVVQRYYVEAMRGGAEARLRGGVVYLVRPKAGQGAR